MLLLMLRSGTRLSISKFATNDLSSLSTPISCSRFFPDRASVHSSFSSLERWKVHHEQTLSKSKSPLEDGIFYLREHSAITLFAFDVNVRTPAIYLSLSSKLIDQVSKLISVLGPNARTIMVSIQAS